MTFINLLLLCYFSFSGPIAGVPNDLRREFKSVHKFREVEVVVGDQTVKARMDLSGDHPVLVYDVPLSIDPKLILQKFVQDKFPNVFSTVEVKPKNNNQREFDLWLGKRQVKGAWIKMQAGDENHNAFALNLPISAEVLEFKNRSGNEALELINGKIIEYREIQLSKFKKITFSEKAQLPERIVVSLKAELDTAATTERVPLLKGSFPDQIVTDSQDLIWFTQPSDALLTSFDVKTNSWFHQPVGSGADGLYIDSEDGLWFGEYRENHLGYFNPTTKEYKRWKFPYEGSAPAIPYRLESDDNVWVTDHENNKIAVFNIKTEEWKVLDVPTASAWPVQILNETVTGSMIVTECYANALGQIQTDTFQYTEIPLGVSSCPAFTTESAGLMWVTLWSEGSILSVHPFTHQITEHKIVFSDGESEYGCGPIHKDPKGNVYFGSLSGGKLYKYSPTTNTLKYVTGVGGLKDGLVVTPQGDVWATETTGALFHAKFSE